MAKELDASEHASECDVSPATFRPRQRLSCGTVSEVIAPAAQCNMYRPAELHYCGWLVRPKSLRSIGQNPRGGVASCSSNISISAYASRLSTTNGLNFTGLWQCGQAERRRGSSQASRGNVRQGDWSRVRCALRLRIVSSTLGS